MSARRLISAGLASLCALAGLFALSPALAGATDRHNYLFQFSEVPSVGPHGEANPFPGPLEGQYGALATGDGEVYVAEDSLVDPGHEYISRLDRYSAATGAFIAQSSLQSSLEYVGEDGLAIGHDAGEMRVYLGGDEPVGGEQHGVVAVYNSSGTLRSIWHGTKTQSGEFGCSIVAGCGGRDDVAVDNSQGVPGDWAANDVYVADAKHRVVDVFEPESGAGEGKLVAELTGPSPSEPFVQPERVAVSPANGDVVVADAGQKAVDIFRPAALAGQYEYIGKLNFSNAPDGNELEIGNSLNLNAGDDEGDIYVVTSAPGVTGSFLLEFSAAGEYEGQIEPETASETGWVNYQPQAVAADAETNQVYVATRPQSGAESGPVFAFGPNIVLPDVISEAASAVGPTGATLNGKVDLDKAGAASCRFVWGESAAKLTNVAPCPVTVEGEGEVPVSASVGGLQPDTAYYYRLEAANAHGTNGESQVQQFSTSGPGLRGESASDVTSTSATLEATLNPDARPTSYYFQYGRGTVYEFAQPAAPGIALGAGGEDVGVSQHLQGLAAGSVYHYRVVAISELEVRPGVVEPVAFAEPDHTFVTQPPGSSLTLPDGRRWELVSPVEMHGGLIVPLTSSIVAQAAAGGGAVTYMANNPPAGEAQGNTSEAQILSTREAAGWSSQDIALPHPRAAGVNGGDVEYQAFSEDLSQALVIPNDNGFASLAPYAWPADTERTPYLRHGAYCSTRPTECFEPLVTAAPGYSDSPPGTSEFGAASKLDGATPDLTHVLLSEGGTGPLYEWSASGSRTAALQEISLLPSGEGGTLVSGLLSPEQASRHAVSSDGSRVVWGTRAALYLRDVDDGETVRLDAVQGGSAAGEASPVFQGASADDSRVFFTDTKRLTADSGAGHGKADLYVCEIVDQAGRPRCELTDLTPAVSGEGANVLGTVLGVSEDGTAVFFVANGVLSSSPAGNGEVPEPGDCPQGSGGPVTGLTCNLYMRRYNSVNASWEAPQLVAVLGGRDNLDWTRSLSEQPTRSSPDGGYLTFMSSRSLTGYDNRDLSSGQPDEEVFLYDAHDNRLVCASCDPTGGRPVGYESGSLLEPGEFVGATARMVEETGPWPAGTWVAAQTPGWSGPDAHQPRFLSNEGRLFFDSGDALAPQDIDGNQDVYEYEPAGVGDCFPGSSGFSERASGCIGLISSGSSQKESTFLDASENGSDVFFLTAESLVSQDVDTAYDVYDARMCTSQAPCTSVAASPPVCTTADSCRAAPTPQPAIFGAPASATFSGAGNLTQAPAPVAAQPRALTRAQTLTRALAACRKDRRAKRAACERLARRRYGPKTAHATKRHKARRATRRFAGGAGGRSRKTGITKRGER